MLRLRTYIAQQLLAKSVCTFRNTLQRSKSMKEIKTELRIQTCAHADAFCSPEDELTILLNIISQTRDQKVMIGEGMKETHLIKNPELFPSPPLNKLCLDPHNQLPTDKKDKQAKCQNTPPVRGVGSSQIKQRRSNIS